MHRFSREFLALAMLFASATAAHAAVVGVEEFNYPNGSIANQTGGTGFTFEQTNEPAAPASTPSDWDGAGTVTNGQLVMNNQNAFREYNGITEGSGSNANEREGAFRGVGNTYYSFQFTSSTPGTGFAGLSVFDFGTEKSFFGQTNNSNVFGINESGAVTPTSVPIVAGQTYTVVAEHDFDRDQLKIWINPTTTGEANADATRVFTSTNWNSRLRLTAGGGTVATYDNLVVATTFAQALNPDLEVTFADTFSKPNNTTLPGSSPDVAAGPWRQTSGSNVVINNGAIDTQGGARVLIGDFAAPLSAGQILTLDFETIDTAGTFHSGGFAGLSLLTGSDSNEQLFIGDLNGSTSTWGISGNGFSGSTAVGGEAVYGQFNYSFDTGEYSLFLNGNSVLAGTATAGLAFDRIRISNNGGGDVAFSNLLVSVVTVPEPASMILLATGTLALLGRRRRLA